MPPKIVGPWRSWRQGRRPLHQDNIFTDCDIVWWTQSDNSDNEPGDGIDEGQSRWWYEPQGADDPDLIVQYHTHKNKRYGQFIFPAYFLSKRSYQIKCRIVNRSGETYEDSWDVTVRKPPESD